MKQLRRRIPSAKVPSTRYTQSSLVSSRKINSNNIPSARVSGLEKLTPEEADKLLEDMAKNDEQAQKTWSRLFVEKYLMKYSWYFPAKDNPKAPCLKKAWAYYEHITLPRHFIGDGRADTVQRKAEPGEHDEPTALYDWRNLGQDTLIEWGTGIDLYFMSLRFFAILMLICGLINLPSILFFAGDIYNGDGGIRDFGNGFFQGEFVLKASAACNNTEWVVCPNCTLSQWEEDKGRIAFGPRIDGGMNMGDQTLVLRNECEGADGRTGFVNFATLIFILISIAVFTQYMKAREVRFDEDKVTTTDYSIVVQNPPPDALEPDDWRNFFSQFSTDGGQVTAVTVALDNHMMCRKLLSRRLFTNSLKASLPVGAEVDLERHRDEVIVAVDQYMREKEEAKEGGCVNCLLKSTLIPILKKLNFFLNPQELVEKIDTLTEEIKQLQEKKYNVTKVFVTFETEDGQRAALDALKVGILDSSLNRTSAVPANCLFEGRVLWVTEPAEPNAVRWFDLSYSFTEKAIRRAIALSVTILMIVVAGFAIRQTRNSLGPFYSAMLTTGFNSTIPMIIKILMIIEPHASEGAFQTSIYLKITLFRWTLSAILAQIITPNTSTLGFESTDLLPTTSAILLSDVWLSPLLRLSDWFTNLKKHVLAPRARTQEQMNLSFQGTFYNLGERYTDFTKVLFVVFFYSALFPAGFFLGFLILVFQYMVDKFSLVRIWGWTPLIGSELAVFSRRFFFSGAALTYCMVSAYAFAQFPYDNICDPNVSTGEDFRGVYNVTNGNNEFLGEVMVNLESNTVYCDQSFRAYEGFSFPPTERIQTDDRGWFAEPDDNDLVWMTDTQERITYIYGWFAVILAFVFLFSAFGRAIYLAIISLFKGTYKPDGDSQNIDFSSNPNIFAYVPQEKRVGQPFPYLFCDIDEIDHGLIGWSDPANSYDTYNLIYDLPHKSVRRNRVNAAQIVTGATDKNHEAPESAPYGFEMNQNWGNERPIFSTIKHYQTEWQKKLAAEMETEDARGDTRGSALLY